MDTLNCQREIYENLLKNNYNNLDIEHKKLLISRVIKEYLVNLINNYYGIKNICERFDITEIITYFQDNFFISKLILILINLISDIQNNTIVWIIDSSYENTQIIYKNNNIDKIISNYRFSIVFNYLYTSFINNNNVKKIKK